MEAAIRLQSMNKGYEAKPVSFGLGATEWPQLVHFWSAGDESAFLTKTQLNDQPHADYHNPAHVTQQVTIGVHDKELSP